MLKPEQRSPQKTPRFANFLLRLFCRKEYLEEVKGDLEENYQWRLREKGRASAMLRYYFDAFSAIRMISIEGIAHNTVTGGMLYSFTKSSIRNFNRNRAYTFLNVFGLALGMAAALFILEFVSDELNYDDFSNTDRIHRISQDFEKNNERQYRTARSEGTLAGILMENLPEIEATARLIDYTWLWEGKNVFTLPENPDKTFIESSAFFADPAIVELFDLELNSGKSRLDEPFTVLVSEEIAKKYFGSVEKAVGQVIRFSSIKSEPDLLVSGVYQYPPFNLQVKPEILVSYNTFNSIIGEAGPHNMTGVESSLTYVKLKEGTAPSSFKDNLKRASSQLTYPVSETTADGLRTGPLLTSMPVGDIHLHSKYPDEVGRLGNSSMVKILIIIAILIVAIAWVNYINLATAHSLNRLKELGVRKVMGARKLEIVIQFFIEALFMNLFALGFALLLVLVGQQLFNQFVQNTLTLGAIDLLRFGIPAVLFFLGGVLCSGLYPLAVFFSSGTTTILKGRSKTHHGSALKRGLIVFQFVSGALLIMATFAIHLQLDFMNAKDKGMEMDRVLVLDGPTVKGAGTFKQKQQRSINLTRRLNELPQVLYAGMSTNIPGAPVVRGRKLSRENNKEAESWKINEIRGTAYLEVLNLRFLAGRGFQSESGENSTALKNDGIMEMVLSYSALKQMGFESPSQALGSLLYGWTYQGSYPLKVVGVVEDYHHEGLKTKKEPMVFMSGAWDYFYMVKLQGDQLAATIDQIENLYESVHQGSPANYYFLDEYFQRQYQSEDVNSKVLTAFTLIAILVACLGLTGLSSFIALQRTKEIGIRKVLGAGLKTVFYLLSKELILLAVLGFLVAAPLGYVGIGRWLDSFAYHIPISASLFLVPLIIILVLAVLAISPRVLKTALMNPVKSLRHE